MEVKNKKQSEFVPMYKKYSNYYTNTLWSAV